MTSYHLEMLDEIYEYADNPLYECDNIICDNLKTIPILSTYQLQAILAVRNETAQLCKKIPYSREDIRSLIENKEINLRGPIAKIEDNLCILEYLFAKAVGDEQ
jgi:hypothetical protein